MCQTEFKGGVNARNLERHRRTVHERTEIVQTFRHPILDRLKKKPKSNTGRSCDFCALWVQRDDNNRDRAYEQHRDQACGGTKQLVIDLKTILIPKLTAQANVTLEHMIRQRFDFNKFINLKIEK